MSKVGGAPRWRRLIGDWVRALFFVALGLAIGAWCAVTFSQLPADSAGLKFLAALLGPGLGALGGFAGSVYLEQRRNRQGRTAPINELRLPLDAIEGKLNGLLQTIRIIKKGFAGDNIGEVLKSNLEAIETDIAKLQPKLPLDYDLNKQIVEWQGQLFVWMTMVHAGIREAERRSWAADKWDAAEEQIKEGLRVAAEAHRGLTAALEKGTA